ncbi:BZ3500_MvSof-1268-A1-R1_Chr7-1g09147 [Microbotryum saponariae]|uniref:BZ3500_MvSof-1268-A1-R1_Chr7-1g09147 protein n=1 Tax=Microbotryum saponariae TaxID=289078 RepID=A0A2X0LQH1_9BASI|nr:BZ3501_MvSof-1269-A2-R1_Chr7-1g08852 [Microbotryum saponariae]SDA02889.1 BZ3500_MvSof-1268-A1-R1_Chr7-1g09147 [Microbotryum saponariae]
MASPAPPASSAVNGHSGQQHGVDTHSTRVDVINTQGGKILCVSDIRDCADSALSHHRERKDAHRSYRPSQGSGWQH